MVFAYLEELLDDDNFWNHRSLTERGYTKKFYISEIKNEIDTFKDQQAKLAAEDKDKRKKRDFYKKLFNKNSNFIEFVFIYWINYKRNLHQINGRFQGSCLFSTQKGALSALSSQ